MSKYKLVRKGAEIWSTKNQQPFILVHDTIVEIIVGEFVKPRQVLFNLPGHFPSMIGLGIDEWRVDLSKCDDYEMPKPWGFDPICIGKIIE